MKVYTKRNEFGTFEKCLVEIKDIKEWNHLTVSLNLFIERQEEAVLYFREKLDDPTVEGYDFHEIASHLRDAENQLELLEMMSKSLSHENELSFDQFSKVNLCEPNHELDNKKTSYNNLETSLEYTTGIQRERFGVRLTEFECEDTKLTEQEQIELLWIVDEPCSEEYSQSYMKKLLDFKIRFNNGECPVTIKEELENNFSIPSSFNNEYILNNKHVVELYRAVINSDDEKE